MKLNGKLAGLVFAGTFVALAVAGCKGSSEGEGGSAGSTGTESNSTAMATNAAATDAAAATNSASTNSAQ